MSDVPNFWAKVAVKILETETSEIITLIMEQSDFKIQ